MEISQCPSIVRSLNSVAAGRMLDAQWEPGEYWHSDPLSDLLITLGGTLPANIQDPLIIELGWCRDCFCGISPSTEIQLVFLERMLCCEKKPDAEEVKSHRAIPWCIQWLVLVLSGTRVQI